jgi:hypothetical protein
MNYEYILCKLIEKGANNCHRPCRGKTNLVTGCEVNELFGSATTFRDSTMANNGHATPAYLRLFWWCKVIFYHFVLGP